MRRQRERRFLWYPELYYDCEGNCVNPSGYAYLEGPLEGQIICEELVVFGCMDVDNPAYNPDANVPDEEACLILGCTIDYACNYDAKCSVPVAQRL